MYPLLESAKVGVIGLGYVGLPLAVEFSKQRQTIGFDINQVRIDELTNGFDSTLECSDEELSEAKHLVYTSSIEELKKCNVFIVTVPTPIDEHKQPDLTPLIKASETVGSIVKKGDVIIYESTVYPGATEDDCIPVIERVSGLKFNQDFYAGYSPERINPGDKEHRVTNILKVTSGSNPEIAEFVDQLYKTIITAGTHKASSIKVAEASKIIENTQRDVNIALMNEFKMIFDKMNICTESVIDAAATKWNFIKLFPGMVGGHCIGVDPYYLVHKAQDVGHIPDIIRKAREINDGMPSYLAQKFINTMVKNSNVIPGSKLLLLGVTFKANCPDIRNTKVIDLYRELLKFNVNIDVYDPVANPSEVFNEYGIELLEDLDDSKIYDGIIQCVAHEEIVNLNIESLLDNKNNYFVIS
ncbi:Vi polysaccharide biosynthesis protein VipA/TviB [Shewanella algae]|uniref:nucleotide sugar dehydrogenase n=1 Tax=Shewanella algae TaxID=38313 RepID=UPI0011844EA5|nr:nucleotide sugar dehydrogenase [Shewanella algae]TVL53755.1 Vi polysaccharide biosynthesis protein VipA/TviB [Shewanella algae]